MGNPLDASECDRAEAAKAHISNVPNALLCYELGALCILPDAIECGRAEATQEPTTAALAHHKRLFAHCVLPG